MIFGRLALRACGARPVCGVISGGFWFCTPQDLCFHFLGVEVGAVGVEVALFRLLMGSRHRLLGRFFVFRVSAMASPATWCLCRWVSWSVSGVVGGSGLGAFNYWMTLVPLITISHFSHQFVVLLFSLMSPTSVFVYMILTFHCFFTLSSHN